MDTLSGAQLARELGTSVPRISRAVEQLGIGARRANGRLAFTPSQAGKLRRALGVSPSLEGLTRTQVRVLAALRSAPFGLTSARAVARRAGLSPTASARALKALLDDELVTRTEEVIAAGRAHEATVWRANLTHPHWVEIDPVLAKVEAPERRGSADERVPSHLLHLFWNTAPPQLDVRTAGPYIARRLLREMDVQGLAWGAAVLGKGDWLQGARARGLDPKARRLGRNLAEAAA
jgi:DNA-binding Lrp family transcriptional regulator